MFIQHKVSSKVSVLEFKVPKVFIKPLAYEKMTYFVQDCENEIGWLGEVTKDDNGDYILHDVFLFSQQVCSAECELDATALCEFTEQLLIQEGGVEKVNKIRLWGHSHVNMGVNPSYQDVLQMRTFGNNGSEYYLMVIANKKGDMRFEVWDYAKEVRVEDAQWSLYITTQLNRAEIKAEIKKKIRSIVDGNNIIDYKIGGNNFNNNYNTSINREDKSKSKNKSKDHTDKDHKYKDHKDKDHKDKEYNLVDEILDLLSPIELYEFGDMDLTEIMIYIKENLGYDITPEDATDLRLEGASLIYGR